MQVFITLFIALLLHDPTLTGLWTLGFDAILTLANCATPVAAVAFIARAESVASHRKEVLRLLAGSVGEDDGAGRRPSLMRPFGVRLPRADSPAVEREDEVL